MDKVYRKEFCGLLQKVSLKLSNTSCLLEDGTEDWDTVYGRLLSIEGGIKGLKAHIKLFEPVED